MDSVGDSSESHFKNHGSGWDQLISLNQSCNFGDGGSSVVHRNEVFNSHYPVMLEHQTHMVPNIPSFGSGSFSEMIPVNAPSRSQIHVDEPANSSPNVRRKRKVSESHSPFDPKKNNEGGRQEVSSMETSDGSKERDGKGKTEPKENYLHMRAKRGQATNSHSLAERVRRERISERMRLLQELVPGCNKITGKAMMLDEIINYVQSLQHQVEFLSMKLSTVNPESNMDIERLLSSKDVSPGLSISHLSPAMSQGNFMGGAPNIPQLYHPMPQMVWDGEFQSLLQMGFNSHTSTNNLGPNGR